MAVRPGVCIGCVLVSFKFKRPQLQKKYQANIDAMYKALNE